MSVRPSAFINSGSCWTNLREIYGGLVLKNLPRRSKFS